QRSRSLPAGETPAPPPSLGPAAPSRQAGAVLADDDGAADTAALSQAKPVVTETMAELYLKQGHQEDALRVYQALLAQRPADLRLRARVQALSPGEKGEGRGVGESVQAFLKRILAAHPRGLRPLPDHAPSGASSPPGSAFSMGLPELEPEPDLIAPGAATRPADDSISLDQVFGDEGSRPALPAAKPRRPPAAT